MYPEPLLVRFGKLPFRTNPAALAPSPFFEAMSSLAPSLTPSGESKHEQPSAVRPLNTVEPSKNRKGPVPSGTKCPAAARTSSADLLAKDKIKSWLTLPACYAAKKFRATTPVRNHRFGGQRPSNSYSLGSVPACALVRPNPSLKRRANGMPPGPRSRYGVHFLHRGPGVLPSAPA